MFILRKPNTDSIKNNETKIFHFRQWFLKYTYFTKDKVETLVKWQVHEVTKSMMTQPEGATYPRLATDY
jgi:hypothetical protein